MASETIKEFLVALGFKVDGESLKRFEGSVAEAGKRVAEIGAVATAVGTAIAAMTKSAVDSVENLSFAAQRAGSTAANMQALGFAAGQVGIGAGQAAGSVEAMMSALRNNPGATQVMRNLGIETKKANGEFRDGTELMLDLVTRLKQFGGPGTPGYAVATQYAQMLGLDPQTLYILEKNLDKFKAELNLAKKSQADVGFNPDNPETKANVDKFYEDYAKLKLDWDNLLSKIGTEFVKPIDEVVQFIDRAIIAFAKLDDESKKWGVTIEGFPVTLGMITEAVIALGGALGGLAAFKGIMGAVFGGGEAAAAATAAKTAATAAAAGGTTAAGGVAGALGTAAAVAAPVIAGAAALGFVPGHMGLNEGEDAAVNKTNAEFAAKNPEYAKQSGQGGRSEDPANQLAASVKRNRAQQYFEGQGWTKEQAAGIVAGLQSESQFDDKAVGDKGHAFGLAQWHQDRQDNFKKWYAATHGGEEKDVTDSSFDDQLAFVNYELTQGGEKAAGKKLKSTTNAYDAGATFRGDYERPKDIVGESVKTGRMAAQYAEAAGARPSYVAANDVSGQTEAPQSANLAPASLTKPTDVPLDLPSAPAPVTAAALAPSPAEQQRIANVNLTQETNIHVLAGPDPETTGNRISAEQTRVNANMVRYAASSFGGQ